MDDLLQEFIGEASEGLEQLDNDLIALEKDPYNQELLRNIFRVMHTIKGTCGFLSLTKLEKVAHASEDVLGKIRDGKIAINADVITTILESVHAVKVILTHIDQKGVEPDEENQVLIEKLLSFSKNEKLVTSEAPEEKSAKKKPSKRTRSKKEEKVVEESVEIKVENPSEVLHSKRTNESIRVNLGTLEELMNMVSELVLTRNQLLQLINRETNSDFLLPVQKLNHVTSELQEAVMKTRMQPIEGAWIGLPKLVRTLAQDLGKKINLVMEGKETELDRQVIELIKDPLTHMIRNAADHGIETPEERLKKGKSEAGTIYLSAFHAGGQIIIDVKDDGRGIDPSIIKKKAIEKGVLSAERAEELSENRIFDLIFAPGFSTSETINTISGRGVGMDVVKNNVEKIGGSAEVSSKPSVGSTFTIKIPLTLAILPALIIRSGKHRFALPHLSVTEIVRNMANSTHKIEYVSGGSFLRLRGEIYPLVDLKNILQLNKEEFFDCVDSNLQEFERTDEEESQQSIHHKHASPVNLTRNFIVILQVGKLKFGIIVDEVFQTQEVVIKPLSRFLKNIKIFSGSTIMGDGKVVMILDPTGIAVAMNRKIAFDHFDVKTEDVFELKRFSFRYITFLAGDETPKAIPVSLISRIEELTHDRIERCDGKYMIQYRNGLMPLIPYGKKDLNLQESSTLTALTFFDGQKYAGLAIDRIIDIVDGEADLNFESHTKNIFGSVVLNGRVAELVNVDAFFRKQIPSWKKENHSGKHFHSEKTILYIEPNSFYSTVTTLIFEKEKLNISLFTDITAAMKNMPDSSQISMAFVNIDDPDVDSLLLLLKKLKEADIHVIGLTSKITELNDVIGKEFLTILLHKMNNLEIARVAGQEIVTQKEDVA